MRPSPHMGHRLAIGLAALSFLPAQVRAEVPVVVTDLPPIHSLVAQVMGTLGTPTLLTEQGANAHSYQLRPSRARALAEADLVFWVGPEMTPWLARSLESLAPNAAQTALLHAPGTHRQDFPAGQDDEEHDEDGHDHAAQEHAGHDHEQPAQTGHDAHGHAESGHGDEAAHDEAGHHEDGHDEDGHDAAEGAAHSHTGLDPHAWLDPANAQTWLGVIAQQLSQQDPENAGIYQANATTAIAAIRDLDAELLAELTPARGKPFVTSHAAYGYFTAHYGLSSAGAVSPGDATEPGAAHLAALRASLSAQGVVCAFPEAAHDPRPVALLTAGSTVRLGSALDPEAATLAPGPDLYANMMHALADSLAGCLLAEK